MNAPQGSAGATAETLSRFVAVLTEEALFALAADRPSKDVLQGLAKRRAEAHSAVLSGVRIPSMTEHFDAWLVELTRAIAPVAPPVWMPMNELIREKVSLEIGARGLRSLFSTKPSDKDVLRVTRLGTLAVRVLRVVFAADGNVDAEEARTIAAVIAALGLPQAEAAPLYTEPTLAVDKLDIYGDLDPGVRRALMRGAWLAAAWDSVDPREEKVIRTLAQKLTSETAEVEAARSEATARVDARRRAGLAAVDAVRFLLSDRVPGPGVQLAADVGTLLLPRRFREEALAQVGLGADVALAKRYVDLEPEEKLTVLAVAWAAALHEDPPVSRLALLRWRHDHLAEDLEERADRARDLVGEWLDEALGEMVAQIR